ncbi:MAG: hypothetical protein PUP93_01940 [Rhizonema sp. NSF051]|nr:hypothetical protein [Rhizonema sp. NSF051]
MICDTLHKILQRTAEGIWEEILLKNERCGESSAHEAFSHAQATGGTRSVSDAGASPGGSQCVGVPRVEASGVV